MSGSKLRRVSTLDVVWCPNPFRPIAERQVRRLVLTGSDTVNSVVRRLALQHVTVQATVNGVEVPKRRWHKKRLRSTDVLVLQQVARGVEGATVTAKLVMSANMAATAATILGYTLAFVANVAIAVGISKLAGSLMRRSGSNAQQADNTPTAYGIESGSNGLRQYEALPLVLGEHRIFPDYASRPFAEFVPDPDSATDVVNNTPVYETQLHDAFSVDPVSGDVSEPWVLIATDGDPGDSTYTRYYGDQKARTYTSSRDGAVTQPHTFVVQRLPAMNRVATYENYVILTANYGDNDYSGPLQWRPLGTQLDVLIRYGYTVIYNTERLTSIFNFGFGDLDISDFRNGSNPYTNYTSAVLHESTVPVGQGDRTALVGYSSAGWPSDAYPDNVQTLDGGALERNPNIEGWVDRTASRPGRYVQIDIAGRLFRQSGGGVENLSCQFEAWYQEPGSDTWQAFPFSPMTITNGSTRVARETFSAWLAAPALRVRVRRVTEEETDASNVSEFELSRIKVFRESAAMYPAQRRLGTMIKATGQINGTMDRLSAFVKAKHWIWTPTSPWDHVSYPGGAGWAWGHTTNPGWLFLYYARGGFLNPAADTPHLGRAGWLDEPNASNGMRLFGAGVENARIDYAAIVAWAQFCYAHKLECRMSVTDSRSAGDVLDDIAAAGRATKTWATGKLGVVWEAAGQPVVATFGMSNIFAETFKVAYLTKGAIDEFEVAYTRSDDDYEAASVSAKVPGVDIPVNRQTDQAVYSMPEDQAQRLVNLLAASEAYHTRTIQFETNAYGATVQRSDIVNLAHDMTRWAYSGRIIALTAEADRIVAVELSSTVELLPDDEALYLQVQPPGGESFTLECALPTEATRHLDVLHMLPEGEGAWTLNDAPGWLDTTVQNAASEYPDTIPEDWTYLAGPTPTPGKRCRIISIEPGSTRRLRLTLRDEYEAYYPLEYGDLDNVQIPDSGERRIARAFNLVATPAAAGGCLLEWELEAAHGADVFVSVNNGPSSQVPVRGHVTIAGRELLLPAYPAGTQLYIEVRPVAAGTPAAVEGDSISLTVP